MLSFCLTDPLPAGTLLSAADGCAVHLYNADGTPYNYDGSTNVLTVGGTTTCAGDGTMQGICLDINNNIYVLDNTATEPHRILKWYADGNFDSEINNGAFADEDLSDCSVDRFGNIYLAGTSSIIKVDPTGAEIARFDINGEPESIELSPNEDRLYFTVRTTPNVNYLYLERGGRVALLHTQDGQNGVNDYQGRQVKVSSNRDVVVVFSSSGNPDFIVRYIGADHRKWKGDMIIYSNRFPSDQNLNALALDNENENLYVQDDVNDDLYKVNYKSHGLYSGWNDVAAGISYGLEVVPKPIKHHHKKDDERKHNHHSLEFLEESHSRH
jgi:hypothetical protein